MSWLGGWFIFNLLCLIYAIYYMWKRDGEFTKGDILISLVFLFSPVAPVVLMMIGTEECWLDTVVLKRKEK